MLKCSRILCFRSLLTVEVHINLFLPDMRNSERTVDIHSGYVTAACAALFILAVCSSYVLAAYAALYALAIMLSASPAAIGGAFLQNKLCQLISCMTFTSIRGILCMYL